MRKATRLMWLGAMALSLLCDAAMLFAQAQPAAASPWEQPAAALAAQIAELMGPGQARLTIRDQSSIPVDEIPAIRRLLEEDLKTHDVTASGAESANTIRVTLSENARERLWVAEVIQGNETRVTMVRAGLGARPEELRANGITLRAQRVLATNAPVLAMLESPPWLIAITPEAIAVYKSVGGQWLEQHLEWIAERRFMGRDPRARTVQNANDGTFQIFFPGTECNGSLAMPAGAPDAPLPDWQLHCRTSDDPWPVAQAPVSATDGAAQSTMQLKAFYNGARDYFTGVVTPSVGVDLPPFYSAALLPRPGGAALLIGGIDGKVQMTENGAVKTVSGTRDWGSDFAVLHSGCGAGDQVIASGSGEAISDSVRAYEAPALEAVPASAPLAMDGTVTAMWSAPDGKSVYASVRHADGDFEVDRVTALCD